MQSRIRVVLVAAFTCTFISLAVGQLSGTKTIDNTGSGNYLSFTLAINDLNSLGVGPGGVTFNVVAGQTFNENPPTITATGTAPNPIVFQKSGAGANPLVIPSAVGTLAPSSFGNQGDWIFRLQSGDYITFDGIDLQDNAAFIGNTQKTEYGYYLIKTATNGCKNITIKNCAITLDKATPHSTAIFVANLDVAGATVAVSTAGGRAEYIRIFNNTLRNVYHGIQFSGFNHTSSPFNLYDQNFDVGVDGGNTISNFGGGSVNAAYGIIAIYANNVRIHNNVISGGTNTTADLRGITTSTGTNSNVEIIGNDVSISGSLASGTAMAIDNSMGGSGVSNAVIIRRNIVHDCNFPLATTGSFSAIMSNLAPFVFTVDSNIVRNNSLAGTGTFTGIDAHNARTLYMRSNQVFGNQKTGASGTMFCTRAANAPITFEFNHIHGNAFTAPSGSAASLLFGYFNNSNPASEVYRYNTIDSLSILGASTPRGSQIVGMNTITGAVAVKTFEGNLVYGLTANVGSVIGFSTTSGATTTMSGNRIYDLSVLGSGSFVYGVNVVSGTSVYLQNNMISDLRAPVSVINPAIAGIYIAGGTSVGGYFNSIFLNATSSSAFFGSAGIYASTGPSVDLRNNIVVNISAAGASGHTVAYRRSGTSLAGYAAASNNNDLYAGIPGPTNLIYYDGTNADQTIGAYKTRVSPRDSSSFTESVPFVNSSTKPYDLHVSTVTPTLTGGGGVTVSSPVSVTQDIDGDLRGVAPDVGADEFASITVDVTPPVFSFTPLANTGYATNRMLGVIINDPSGLAGSPNGPRLYYRKSTDVSFVIDNAPTGTAPGYTFAINYALVGGGTALPGDTIQYYLAAADVPGNSGTSPAGGGGIPPGTTPPPTFNSYRIVTASVLPFSENFDAGTTLPAGWAGNMVVLSNHGTSGSNGLALNLSAGTTSGNANTPVIGPITATSQIEFDYRIVTSSAYPATGATLAAGDSIVVRLSTDDGATYAGLFAINQGNHVTGTTFTPLLIPIGAYAGMNGVVKWDLYRGTGDYYVDIDNVQLREPPVGLPDPAGIVSPTNVATGVAITATLNWSAPAGGGPVTGYKLYFGTDGGGVTAPTGIVGGTDLGGVLTYDPTPDMAYSTTYYWQVVPTGPGGDATGCPIWSYTTAQPKYIIEASAGPNGSITPSGSVVVDSGVTATFSFSPASGFSVDSVIVDGGFVGRNSPYAFAAISVHHSIRVVFALIPAPVGGFTVADNFNGPAVSTLSGLRRWVTFGHNEVNGTMQRNGDSTISPSNPTLYLRGGVAWDSLLSDGTRLGLIVRQKGGAVAPTSCFSFYFRMNGTDLTSSGGYCLLYMDRPTSVDILYLMRATNGNTLTPLATLFHEVVQGDTLIVQVDANKTMKGLVYGANGVRDSISVVDNTFNPAQWYSWIRGVVLPTPVKMDNFMVGPVSSAPQGQSTPAFVESSEKPSRFALEQNYPNPFNPLTVIRYSLPVTGHITLKVYNVLGQEELSLVDEVQDAGYGTVGFDGSKLPSGVYFYRLVAGEYGETRKMVLMK